MFKWVRMRKFFLFAFILALGFFELGGGVFAQIKLEYQSDPTTQRVGVTFENQVDVNNFIIGINDVCGEVQVMKMQNRGIGKVVAYDCWIETFKQMFWDRISGCLLSNEASAITNMCKILALDISEKLKILGNRTFIMVDYTNLNTQLEEFIRIHLGGKHAFPYQVIFSAKCN